MAVGWDSKLATVVGSAAKKLADELELVTVGDLLGHYPRTLVQRGETSALEGLSPGEHITVVARVVSAESKPYLDRRRNRRAARTEVSLGLGDGRLWMTFFEGNAGRSEWRAAQFPIGTRLLASGKVSWNSYSKRWELAHPDYELDDVDREQSGLQPIYPASAKVSSWQIENAVRVALDLVDDLPDLLPQAVREARGLLDVGTAYRWIHRPADWQQFGAAQKRLRFDEALVTQVALMRRRASALAATTTPRRARAGGLFDAFGERLPFDLTQGQREVEQEIEADLAGAHPMHRLLQGEVGSGKTLVALRAMLRVVDAGGQAALLAPTEVLAQQHHRSITRMLGDLAGGGMLGSADEATTVHLLTGSMPVSARKPVLLDAASGQAGILIGTHALLEDKVQFADLGLVVVDEQHRFGVEQRAALSAKGGDTPPHVLVMTATPIPRTVAMTVFGDLDTSSLRELPAGRSPIQSNVVPLADRPGWWERVWARVREEVEKGHQVYVVCPRITGDEADDTDDLVVEDVPDDTSAGQPARPPLSAVEEIAPSLALGPLQGLRVGALHGRMPAEHKDEVMRDFAAGEIDVLISTTVIEVGVDVANATAIVVLDADRFGMSQLHQLRGRVGRGGHPGLCLLVTRAEAGSAALERLERVASTLDGFEIADADLELRKEGDVLGSRQSGNRRTLRLLSVVHHADLIAEARELAQELVDDDPELGNVPELRAAVVALEEAQRAEFLDKG